MCLGRLVAPVDTENMKRTAASLGIAALTLSLALPAWAAVTICHAAGLDDTTHFVTLTIGEPAVYGPGGHFNEDGTPAAGHELDYFGECVGEEDGTTTTTTVNEVVTTTTAAPGDTTTTTTSQPTDGSTTTTVGSGGTITPQTPVVNEASVVAGLTVVSTTSSDDGQGAGSYASVVTRSANVSGSGITELPFTGISTWLTGAIALGLIMAGTTLLVWKPSHQLG